MYTGLFQRRVLGYIVLVNESTGRSVHHCGMTFYMTLLLLLCRPCMVETATTYQSYNNNDRPGDSGQLTFEQCGTSNPNGHFIDLKESSEPGPFHDLTKFELQQVKEFLQNDPNIRAVKTSLATLNSSYVYMVDLYPAPKKSVVKYLDGQAPQPPREARVMVFRGDLNPSVVQEYVCGPLPNIRKCKLIKHSNRRNPVEFSVRPFTAVEIQQVTIKLWLSLDDKVGRILIESYNATANRCGDVPTDCLTFQIVPVGTSLLGDINKRRLWLSAQYSVIFSFLHPVDFAILCDVDGTDPDKWRIEKVYYSGQMYDSVEELVEGYNAGRIPKTRLQKPAQTDNLFSTLNLRGEPMPPNPQRPPQQVEPDGKRYTVKDRQVKYLDWSFNFRMSSFTGPSIFDVRYKGERIAYEIGLQEIAVFYSGSAPLPKLSNYVDSAFLLGTHSKALIPGGDCPESATLINQTFWRTFTDEPSTFDSAFCLFEHNNGVPLRRHSSYESFLGSFYGGMLDSVLTLRSILNLGNYDYVIDFNFHQNGVVQGQIISTAYIQSGFSTPRERDYGYQMEKYIFGPVHHHKMHFKIDLDIGGTSNRYETVDIVKDQTPLQQDPSVIKHQTKIESDLKETEGEAVFDYDFRRPKYHLVYNNDKRNKFNVEQSYRIHLDGMAHNIIPPDVGNDRSTPWAHHQMVVSKHKDNEQWSSSNYAGFDSQRPLVNFTAYHADNERIVDEGPHTKDLVFWVTLGLHHVPHAEDLPVTASVGKELKFYLMPYNYFPECPSMSSRDALYIKLTDQMDSAKGVTLDRNGNSGKQCVTPKPTLEELLVENPDMAVQSRRQDFII
ncbi:hypothetical protein Btru_057179 [Bulinus truncatus]|nr:hypothetical protein Btru_057179 [Bulinus truncatus]